MYTAPSGTHIETVCLDFNLRRDGHHQAEILAYPGFQVLATGGDGPAGWTNRCYDLRHSQLIVRLACAHAGGCPEGLNAHAFVRNVVIALADDVDPAITAFGGDMTEPGWLRGTKTLIADAADAGSGVFHLVGYVNGEELTRVPGTCGTGGLPWNFAVKLVPCESDSQGFAIQRDTSAGAFVNGGNEVTAYVADYAGNVATRSTLIYVDNEEPRAAFQSELDPADPELIQARVSDRHSGVRSAQLSYRAVGADNWLPLDTRLVGGTARARVDSSAVPSGEYEFTRRSSETSPATSSRPRCGLTDRPCGLASLLGRASRCERASATGAQRADRSLRNEVQSPRSTSRLRGTASRKPAGIGGRSLR